MSDPPPLGHRALHEVTFCVLDLETTGTDPAWDDITEVGAILVRGGERLGTFHTLVGPGEIGGVLAALVGFVGDAVLTGHNIGFDRRFLDAALLRSGRAQLAPPAIVDTMHLARVLLRGDVDDHRLGTLAERFDLAHRPCHRAFEDAAATVDLLHLLVERAWSFAATALDDLQELPALAGHRWADRLRLTAPLPRRPGVVVGVDHTGAATWVMAADDVRREVRALFSRGSTRVQANVVRDTATWHVHEPATELGRAVARERLLHSHEPRSQRAQIVGRDAAYVTLGPPRTPGGRWRATSTRTPARGAIVCGPVTPRALAREAAAALDRIAASGVALDEVVDALHRAGGMLAASAALDTASSADPVTAAIARRDADALRALASMHESVRRGRVLGLHDEPGLPDPLAGLPPGDEPLPLELLSEVLLVAGRSGDGAEAHRHRLETEHEVAAPHRQPFVDGELEVVAPAQQLLEQHP